MKFAIGLVLLVTACGHEEAAPPPPPPPRAPPIDATPIDAALIDAEPPLHVDDTVDAHWPVIEIFWRDGSGMYRESELVRVEGTHVTLRRDGMRAVEATLPRATVAAMLHALVHAHFFDGAGPHDSCRATDVPATRIRVTLPTGARERWFEETLPACEDARHRELAQLARELTTLAGYGKAPF